MSTGHLQWAYDTQQIAFSRFSSQISGLSQRDVCLRLLGNERQCHGDASSLGVTSHYLWHSGTTLPVASIALALLALGVLVFLCRLVASTRLFQDHMKLQEHVKCRFCCEWQIIRERFFPEWCGIAVFIYFFQGCVVRTFSSYRHRQVADYIPESWCVAIGRSQIRPSGWKDGDSCVQHARGLVNQGSLFDILHEVLPNLEENPLVWKAREAIQLLCILVVVVAVIYGSLFRKPGQLGKRPYFAAILTRFLRVMGLVCVLSPIFTTMTSLPAPGAKCAGPREVGMRASSWMQTFRASRIDAHCGDVIFPVDLSALVVLVSVFFHYGKELVEPQLHLYHTGRWFLGIAVIIQSVLGILVREHYTVDVMTTLISTPVVWYIFYCDIGPDTDPTQFLAERKSGANNSELKKKDEPSPTSDEEFEKHMQYEGLIKGDSTLEPGKEARRAYGARASRSTRFRRLAGA